MTHFSCTAGFSKIIGSSLVQIFYFFSASLFTTSSLNCVHYCVLWSFICWNAQRQHSKFLSRAFLWCQRKATLNKCSHILNLQNIGFYRRNDWASHMGLVLFKYRPFARWRLLTTKKDHYSFRLYFRSLSLLSTFMFKFCRPSEV